MSRHIVTINHNSLQDTMKFEVVVNARHPVSPHARPAAQLATWLAPNSSRKKNNFPDPRG